MPASFASPLRRVVAGLVVLACAAMVAVVPRANAPQGDEQARVFRGGVDLIQVDAYPAKDGRSIAGLTAADFEVLEDGKPQRIQSVEYVQAGVAATTGERRDPESQDAGNARIADPHARAFVIYLDTYHVNLDGSGRTRAPLVAFLNRMLSSSDLFAVTSPHLRPRDLVFVQSTTTLERELSERWNWGQQRAGMQAYVMEDEERDLAACYGWLGPEPELAATMDRRREDLVLRHLEELVTHLGTLRDARTTMVVFTRGWPLFGPDEVAIQHILANASSVGLPVSIPTSGRSPARTQTPGTTLRAACNDEIQRLYSLDDAERFRRILETAARLNVAFYPVNPLGIEPPNIMTDPTASMRTLRLEEASFKTLAENTGGLWGLRDDLDANLRAVADDVGSYYLLGYYSSNAALDGEYRRIEVRLRPSGDRVRARPGYTAARSLGSAPPRPAGVDVSQALAGLGALDRTGDLNITTAVAGPSLIVVAELSPAKAGVGDWAAGGEVSIDVADSAGVALPPAAASVDASGRGVLVAVPRGGSTGPWRARIRGRAGRDLLEEIVSIEVPRAGQAAALLFRAPGPPRAPFAPTALPQFRRTERVRAEWRGVDPTGEMSARVLDRRGLPLPVPVTVTSGGEGLDRFVHADVVLAGLAPGDYVIEVRRGSSTLGTIAVRITP